VTWCQTWARK